MAIPTSYTELSFKQYLHASLRAVATALGWAVLGGQYDEILNDALLAYGTDDIASITSQENIKKLRTLGKVALWKAVVDETAGDYDFSADGGSYKRSQIHAQARAALEAAQDEAAVYDEAYRVGQDTMRYVHDPYQYYPDEARGL